MKLQRRLTWIAPVILAIVLLLFGAIGYLQVKEPSYKVRKTSPSFLSVMDHVQQMTQKIHPMGSKENEEVRNYLINKITEMGYQCDVQTTKDANGNELVNLLVTVDIPETNKGVMFVAHYDSTSNGPGAGDDAIGTAALLEAMNTLRFENENTPKNDIYFLITDGEEKGLLGAKQFVADNPDMKDKVSLVINFEARGNQGALLMFETSENNKNIVKQFVRAVKHTTAFSFSAEVYKKMPNDTDLTVFLNEGYAGMNFAMIGGVNAYHNEMDTYENLSRGSAWQYMETALQLISYYKDADLSRLESAEDAVYFPLFPGNTVIFSGIFMKVIALLCAAAMIVRIIYLILIERIEFKQVVMAFIIILLTIIISGAGAFIVHLLFKKFSWAIYLQWVVAILFGGCGLLASYFLTDKKETIVSAAGLIFALLSVITALFFNSISYLFTLPLIVLLVIPIFIFRYKRKTFGDSMIALIGMVCECIIVPIIYVPILYMVYLAFGASIGFALTAIAMLASIPVAVLYYSYMECIKDIRR